MRQVVDARGHTRHVDVLAVEERGYRSVKPGDVPIATRVASGWYCSQSPRKTGWRPGYEPGAAPQWSARQKPLLRSRTTCGRRGRAARSCRSASDASGGVEAVRVPELGNVRIRPGRAVREPTCCVPAIRVAPGRERRRGSSCPGPRLSTSDVNPSSQRPCPPAITRPVGARWSRVGQELTDAERRAPRGLPAAVELPPSDVDDPVPNPGQPSPSADQSGDRPCATTDLGRRRRSSRPGRRRAVHRARRPDPCPLPRRASARRRTTSGR